MFVALAMVPVVVYAEDVPRSVLRVEVPACEPGSGSDVGCVCTPGTACLSRTELETLAAIAESESNCRVDLISCREQPPTVVETGWSDWQLAGWIVGAVVMGAALGVAGYAIAVEVGN